MLAVPTCLSCENPAGLTKVDQGSSPASSRVALVGLLTRDGIIAKAQALCSLVGLVVR